jgi:hypothetical protein
MQIVKIFIPFLSLRIHADCEKYMAFRRTGRDQGATPVYPHREERNASMLTERSCVDLNKLEVFEWFTDGLRIG